MIRELINIPKQPASLIHKGWALIKHLWSLSALPRRVLSHAEVACRRGAEGPRQNKHLWSLSGAEGPLLLSLLFFLLPLLSHSQQLSDRIERFALPNGITVVCHQDTTLPVVHAEVAILAGSLYEDRKSHGITHLWERSFWDAGDVNVIASEQRRKRIGMVTHSWLQPEATQFAFTVTADSLRPALDYMRQCITSPTFDPYAVETGKEIISQQFDRLEANPEWFLDEDLRTNLWGKTHRKRSLGQYFRIRELTEEDLYDAHRAWVNPRAMRMVVSGAITADQLEALLLECGLGEWQMNATPSPTVRDTAHLPPPDANAAWFMSVNEYADQPQVILSWAAPDPADDTEGYFAAVALTTWMNDPDNALRRKLEGEGYALRCITDYQPGHAAGVFSLRVTPTRDSMRTFLPVLFREVIRSLRPGGITATEWQGACLQVSRELQLMASTPTAWNHFLSLSWGLGVALPEYTHTAVAELQTDAMDRLLLRYFTGKTMMMGVLTSTKDEGAIDLAASKRMYEQTLLQEGAVAVASVAEPASPSKPTSAEEETTRVVKEIAAIRIRFEVNALLPEGSFLDTLAAVAKRMQTQPQLEFYINSYTDAEGDGVKNYLLSVQRAEAIRDHLVKAHGISASRLHPRGYGEAFPEFNEKIRSEDIKNRRVTFTVKEKGGEG